MVSFNSQNYGNYYQYQAQLQQNETQQQSDGTQDGKRPKGPPKEPKGPRGPKPLPPHHAEMMQYNVTPSGDLTTDLANIAAAKAKLQQEEQQTQIASLISNKPNQSTQMVTTMLQQAIQLESSQSLLGPGQTFNRIG